MEALVLAGTVLCYTSATALAYAILYDVFTQVRGVFDEWSYQAEIGGQQRYIEELQKDLELWKTACTNLKEGIDKNGIQENKKS